MLIAAMADRIVDPAVPIDLLNVAFENPRTHGDTGYKSAAHHWLVHVTCAPVCQTD